MVRPIRRTHGPDPSTHRQAHGDEEDRTTLLRVMVRYSNHEALEGQAHHPEQSRRTDGVSKGEHRKLTLRFLGIVLFYRIDLDKFKETA